MIKLLREYPFDVITITEICQEADVVRATFYRNFSSKEDVLKVYINILIYDYFGKLKKLNSLDLKILAQNYFSYWAGEKELLEILRRNDLTNLLLEDYIIVEKYLRDIYPDEEHQKGLSEIEKYYITSFHFAGLWRLIFLWAERNFAESVEEMTAIFMKTMKSE